MSTRNIERLFNVVNQNVATTNGTLDYSRVTDAIIRLCDELTNTDTEEDVWYLGEHGEFCLADLIAGAYWHFSEYHNGQASKGYLAMCNLGAIYQPNYACGPEESTSEETAYELLSQMAEQEF